MRCSSRSGHAGLDGRNLVLSGRGRQAQALNVRNRGRNRSRCPRTLEKGPPRASNSAHVGSPRVGAIRRAGITGSSVGKTIAGPIFGRLALAFACGNRPGFIIRNGATRWLHPFHCPGSGRLLAAGPGYSSRETEDHASKDGGGAGRPVGRRGQGQDCGRAERAVQRRGALCGRAQRRAHGDSSAGRSLCCN